MKTLLYALVLSVFCTCAFAQKITGKWRCNKEVAKVLRMDYEDYYCTYKFKKNGTLIIKFNGERTVDHSTTSIHTKIGTFRIKGKYELNDGKISSIIKNEDVDVGATEIYYSRTLFEQGKNSASFMHSVNSSRVSYSKRMERKLRIRLINNRFLWDWDNEPITITKRELVIGEKLKCKR